MGEDLNRPSRKSKTANKNMQSCLTYYEKIGNEKFSPNSAKILKDR